MSNAPHRQSGVVPFRVMDGAIEVLLITSRRRGRWIFPKGYVHDSMTPRESAAKEAREEAGVIGELCSWRLGRYEYRKRSGRFEVEMFALEVTDLLDEWDERDQRLRRWVAIDRVESLVDVPPLVELARALSERLDSR